MKHCGYPIATVLALVFLSTVPARIASGQAAASQALKARAVDRLEQTIEPPRGPRRMALCIGIDRYQTDGYSPLTCAIADAKDLGAQLAKLGYDVTVMTDDAADAKLRPTFDNLSRELADFTASATNPDDTLVISFSGHGDKVGGQTGLLPLDYGPHRHRLITLGVLMDDLNQPDCRASKKLLILDACRSAAQKPERLMSSGFLQSLGNPESFLVLTGCGENQVSVEDPNLGHGRLTGTLLEGLQGKAFEKGKEFLLVAQLANYVQATFREHGWAATQSPKFFGSQTAEVSFDVARRNLPKPKPLNDYDKTDLARSLKDARDAWEHRNFTLAVNAATHALRIDEKNADALAERALAYLSLGYPEEADSDASLAMENDPRQVLASFVRGMTLSDDKLSERSALHLLQQVTTAVDADPGRWPILANGGAASLRFMRIGYILSQFEDDPPSAAASFSRVIEMKDAPVQHVARALVARAEIYMAMGAREKALADCARAIAMKDAPAVVGLRAAWLRALDQRVTDLTEVIETKDTPADQIALPTVVRGESYGALGMREKEAADYTRVIEMSGAPADTVARALRDRATASYRQGKLDAALADARRALNCDARNYRAADKIGLILLRQGKLAEARKAYEVAVAVAHRRGFRFAIDDLIELRDKLSGPPETAVFLGWLEMHDGDSLGGREDLAAYLKTHPSGSLTEWVGELLAVSGKQAARQLLIRGRRSYESGELDSSLEDSRKAFEMDAALHDAPYQIGLILLRQGKLAEARKAYEVAVAHGPEFMREAIHDLIELRDDLSGPPETVVFLGWLRILGEHEGRGRFELAAYLKGHPVGPLAPWAAEVLAAPGTRPAAATQPAEKQSP